MPEQTHYCLFDTDLGACGLAWSERGLARLQLPEADRSATEERLQRRLAGADPRAPPLQIAQAIADLQRYFAGKRVDFSQASLDLSRVGAFYRAIYDAARRIGWGETTTYGEIARRVDTPGAARAVGQAMGRNPVPIIIPCHRVLASGDRIGGFSAFGGRLAKEQLLALEGVHLGGGTPLLPGLLPAGRRA